ncbi:hypothetical protein CDD83_6609 [Cordyceps sp. RAO-2017]|nr:hypothetical protein CDD83_6609 [Cordyceps sp. RAO-2017]
MNGGIIELGKLWGKRAELTFYRAIVRQLLGDDTPRASGDKTYSLKMRVSMMRRCDPSSHESLILFDRLETYELVVASGCG